MEIEKSPLPIFTKPQTGKEGWEKTKMEKQGTEVYKQIPHSMGQHYVRTSRELVYGPCKMYLPFAVRSRIFASSERYLPNSLNNQPQDFPGGPEAKTTCFQRRGQGSIPGQGTRSHKLQLRVCLLKLKILPATTKTWHIQINKYMLERNQSLKCCAVRQYHRK